MCAPRSRRTRSMQLHLDFAIRQRVAWPPASRDIEALGARPRCCRKPESIVAERPEPLRHRRMQRIAVTAPLMVRMDEQRPDAAVAITRAECDDFTAVVDDPGAPDFVECREVILLR